MYVKWHAVSQIPFRTWADKVMSILYTHKTCKQSYSASIVVKRHEKGIQPK